MLAGRRAPDEALREQLSALQAQTGCVIATARVDVSDGAAVDVEAYFSENPDCSLSAPALFTAPESCCVLLRLAEVNPEAKTVTVRNVADCEGGFAGQVIKSGGAQAFLIDLLPPGATISADATLTVVWGLKGVGTTSVTLVR